MADSGEAAQQAGEQGAATGGNMTAGQSEGPRRRRGPAEVQEAIDELAQETTRTTLLDCLERQVRDTSGKDRYHVSRIVFGFSLGDDKKTQSAVEQEFSSWREKQENHTELTGVLAFTSQGALHFLEGPTELLFGAVQLFQSMTVDTKPPAPQRSALISQVRIIHFTELHGVRASTSWCAWVHPGKVTGGLQVNLEDAACSDYVFRVYHKFLLACLAAKEQAEQAPCEEASSELEASAMQAVFKRISVEMMPTVDEVFTLLNKNTAEYFFTFAEFEKVFMAPFQLVLHSELLWPMSPALVY